MQSCRARPCGVYSWQLTCRRCGGFAELGGNGSYIYLFISIYTSIHTHTHPHTHGGFAELGGNGSCIPEHEHVLSRSGQWHPTGMRLLSSCRARARITRHARSFSDHAMFITPCEVALAMWASSLPRPKRRGTMLSGSEGALARTAPAISQASQKRPQCGVQCRRGRHGPCALAPPWPGSPGLGRGLRVSWRREGAAGSQRGPACALLRWLASGLSPSLPE